MIIVSIEAKMLNDFFHIDTKKKVILLQVVEPKVDPAGWKIIMWIKFEEKSPTKARVFELLCKYGIFFFCSLHYFICIVVTGWMHPFCLHLNAERKQLSYSFLDKVAL